jgi:enolase-phosphatase E1
MSRVTALDESQIRVILLDIEGTTTPVSLVDQTLFPYATRMLQAFLLQHAQEPEIVSLIDDLRAQHDLDESNGLKPLEWVDEGVESRLRSSIAYCQWLIAKDSKCTPLKVLQGKIWQEGYQNGELHGEVYPDVPPAFERWRRRKKMICIYSSGSVLAQQLLFRSTPAGDLTAYISVFFDTRVGAKTESESYRKITGSFSHPPQQFLFISDAVKEIEAARAAGMRALWCVRDENASELSGADEVIHNFNVVFPD